MSLPFGGKFEHRWTIISCLPHVVMAGYIDFMDDGTIKSNSQKTCTAAMLLMLLYAQLCPVVHAQSDAQRAYPLCHEAYRVGTEQHRYAEGIELLKQAQKLDSKDPWIPSTIGRYYMHVGLNGDALPYLEQALHLAPTDTDEVDNVLDCHERLNHNKRVLDVGRAHLTLHGKEPATAKIWQRVAHAHAKLKEYKESYSAYDHYFDFKSNNSYDWYSACKDFEAPEAAQYLYPLYVEFAKRFPGDSGVLCMAPKVRRMTQLSRSAQSASTKDEFDELITYKDPNNPNVSKAFYGMVKEGLRSIPAYVWKPLIGYGCKVMLAPRITDVSDEKVDDCPRGYAKGSTYRNVPALYLISKKYIAVAEFYQGKDGKELRHDDPAQAVCHELGHAFDMYLGSQLDTTGREYYPYFSHGKAFTEAYKKDAAAVPANAKKEIAYYVQADRAGQEELFAELFPIIFDESAVMGSEDELLARSFPTTIALMASTLQVKWTLPKARSKHQAPAK